MILPVSELESTARFFTEVLGFSNEGTQGPFTIIRVNPDLTLQLAPWGTEGGIHLAFALSRSEFDAVFARIKAAGLKYGDAFHSAQNMQGPGDEAGARGPGKAVYLFDPDQHLIEIRHYE